MMEIKCHACGQVVPNESEARRGMLINLVAALGARLVELRWQLDHVPNKSARLIVETIENNMGQTAKRLHDARIELECIQAWESEK